MYKIQTTARSSIPLGRSGPGVWAGILIGYLRPWVTLITQGALVVAVLLVIVLFLAVAPITEKNAKLEAENRLLKKERPILLVKAGRVDALEAALAAEISEKKRLAVELTFERGRRTQAQNTLVTTLGKVSASTNQKPARKEPLAQKKS